MFFVVNFGGTYKVWKGTSAGAILLLEDNPGAQLDTRPFETREEADERRLVLIAAAKSALRKPARQTKPRKSSGD